MFVRSLTSPRTAATVCLTVDLFLLIVAVLAVFSIVSLTVLLVALAVAVGLQLLLLALVYRLERSRPEIGAVVPSLPRVESRAVRDEATGLYHRWYLEQRIDVEA